MQIRTCYLVLVVLMACSTATYAGDNFTLSGEMIYPNRTNGQMPPIMHRSTSRFYHLGFL